MFLSSNSKSVIAPARGADELIFPEYGVSMHIFSHVVNRDLLQKRRINIYHDISLILMVLNQEHLL